MRLEKARLQEITTAERPRPVGDPITLQFNPTTLKISLKNQMEGGGSRGRQRQQYIGSSSAQLSFELLFDTTDTGASVRALRSDAVSIAVSMVSRSASRTTPAARWMYISYVWPLERPCFWITSLDFLPELMASEQPPERKPWTVSRSTKSFGKPSCVSQRLKQSSNATGE